MRTNSPEGISLHDFSDIIYSQAMFEHLTDSDGAQNKNAYKAALIRGIIGRRPAYETNAETMGFIYLDYPALKTAQIPAVLSDYAERNNIIITESDWQNYLKLAIDYVLRLNNHIQPLAIDERKYILDNNLSSPIAALDDTRNNLKHWPSVKKNKNGEVSDKQPRLVVLLCAGLGIHTLEQLQTNVRIIEAIVQEAWNTLVNKEVLTKVTANDTEGYNNPRFYPDDRYVGCYYLDLSGREGNDVCKIKRLEEAWICPVTNQLLDTTFCGYSPLIVGRLCKKLCKKSLVGTLN